MFGIIPLYSPNKLGEAQITLANFSLASELLGWEPKINLVDYINKEL